MRAKICSIFKIFGAQSWNIKTPKFDYNYNNLENYKRCKEA